MKEKQNRRKLFLKVFLTILAVFTVLIVVGLRIYMNWAQPPEVDVEAAAPVPEALKDADGGEADAVDAERTGEVYTFLLVGNDDGRGNTDTILIGRLDTGAHQINVVSIPRDTLVNVPWDVRKINAIYAGTANSGGVAIEGLKKQLRNLTGFTVDCYAIVDLDVFMEVVDLIGGVDFDLPRDMHYDDPNQDLHIHLNAGFQHLDGRQAMGVMRYRSGYANGDLGRVEMQQKFLKAIISQFITLGNIPNLPAVVNLVADKTDTDLTAGNIAFFVQEALRCSSEDICFYTMPNDPATVAGLSYTFVDLQPWLEMINDKLNPYAEPITADNLDVVYLSGGIHSTTGVVRDPGYYSRQSIFETQSSPEPSAAPQPVQTPAPQPAADPTPTAAPEPVEAPAPPASEPEPAPNPEPESEPEPAPAPEPPAPSDEGGEGDAVITG